MRFLIIIPDLNSGSGVCVKAIAKCLITRGHNVIILTRETTKDDTLDIRSFSTSNKRKSLFLSLKRILLYPVWPFLSLKDYRKIYEKSKLFIENNDVDVVVAVYNPIESLYAIHKLRKKFNFTFVAYFLDAFYAGQRPRFMPEFLKRKYALFWENKILDNADSIIMMKAAEPEYKYLDKKSTYLNRITFLDIPLYIPENFQNRERKYFPKDEKVLFYAGALPRNIRNPKYLLDLFTRVTIENLHLYIAGRGDYNKLLEYYVSNNNNIHILGSIPHNIIKEMYYEADALINIGNTLNYMVPSKIFEYMSTGKPIVSTSKVKDDPCVAYLNNYSNSLVIDENVDVNHNIQNFVNFIQLEHYSDIETDLFHLNRPETFVNYMEETYEKLY